MAVDGESSSSSSPRGIPIATVARLVDRIITAPDRRVQQRVLVDLVRVAISSDQVLPAAYTLSESPVDGERLVVEFLSLLPDPLPKTLLPPAPKWLSAESVPISLRVAAAGKLIAVAADTPAGISQIVRALTLGLNEPRFLERLYTLQSSVDHCNTIDEMVKTLEAKVRLACPKCAAVLPHHEFIPHLWTSHRLLYEQGQARDPASILDAEVTAAGAAGNPEALDRAFALTRWYYPDTEPSQVFQALVSRGSGDPTQIDALLQRATRDRCGLCPICLNAIPDPIPELPPECSLTHGLLSADGFTVEVIQTPTTRELHITEPGEETEVFPDPLRAVPVRLRAVMIAFSLAVVLSLVLFVIPTTMVSPLLVGGVSCLLIWGVYWSIRATRQAPPDRTSRAVDFAWTRLVPGIGRSRLAIRFLTRLCRTSLNEGSFNTRRKVLAELVEHAAVLADRSPSHARLFAAARVLEVLDDAQRGKERVIALTRIFEPFLKGEVSPAYIETVSELVLASGSLTSGDARRLGIAVIVSGFEAGMGPLDLLTITRFCPWLRRVVLGSRLEFVSLLHAVWQMRSRRLWSSIGEATTVIELVRENPTEGRRLLADHPDLLLRVEADRRVEDQLGPILLTANGLIIRDLLISDPATPMRYARDAQRDWLLRIGEEQLPLDEKLPNRVLEELQGWVAFWFETLLPAAEQSTRRGVHERTAAILAPLAIECPLCRTVCVHRTGLMGTLWQAISPR